MSAVLALPVPPIHGGAGGPVGIDAAGGYLREVIGLIRATNERLDKVVEELEQLNRRIRR